MNGDGLDDLICKDNGIHIWYSKNLGNPSFGHTTFQHNFCQSSRPPNFHMADVNGDNKKDFLCINKLGYVQIGISFCK